VKCCAINNTGYVFRVVIVRIPKGKSRILLLHYPFLICIAMPSINVFF